MNKWIFLSIPIVLLASFIQCSQAALHYAGEYAIATGEKNNGIEPYGLSAIAWDKKNNIYYAINDSRNNEKEGQASLYKIDIALSDQGITGVKFLEQRFLLDNAGQPFPSESVDGEGLALTPDGNALLWTSELGSPLRLSNKNGILQSEFTSLFPAHFNVAGEKESPTGVRSNLSWESVTFVPSGESLFLAVEGTLKQDGELAGPLNSGSARIIKFSSSSSGQPLKHLNEFIYITDPVPRVTEFGINDNGVSDMLALNDHQLLVIERSGRNVSKGYQDWDFNVRVYLADISAASDISHIPSLRDYQKKSTIQPVSKKLLIDFNGYMEQPDCIEGITFGPDINGHKTLIFVTDNNQQPHQKTKFYLFIDNQDELGGLIKS